ncbi:hypothetical protein H5410_059702 [Solanum commersonii]|uniref:CCHC-type domain-containing protein n=1 Tax=Solanum commersonii TaxID=4109 RepID=A0A9J5W3Q8_SOLCO|nr:hypothetical protein H5410_059702 [Solanum commersonii]
MLERDFTLSNGEITRSVFPPQQSFQINKNDKIVNFNAFSKLLENDTALVTVQHVNAIIKQNNYANIYMSILGEHIMSLHEKVDRLLTLLPTKVKEDFKIKDYSDLESFLEKKFKGGGVQPLNTDNFIEGEPSNKKEFYDSLNKISEKYARKPVQRMFYYPRPTPQDVLLEEHEHIITNSYNGKEIYEWNIDGYTDRQIFTTVHRMLMYSTICKTNKNSDRTIADMITAGFTGQLKGWWDNYLNQTQRDTILMAVKQEGDRSYSNAGRWSDNSETIRTLLQNLRCKSLTSFRYYKDVFLCRVMELPECNSTHWKSKFIDGLPTLFAERVRKSLRGDDHSINYDDYTYGKLISACVQEGLSLCNEIKLNQQIKRHRLTERKQLGEFCEQFAFDIPKQKSKDVESSSHKKKKSSKKDYEKWKQKKIEKKLRRAEEGKGDSSKRKKKYRFNKSDTCHKCGRYGHYAKDCRRRESSSTSEDLKALQQEDYMTSEDECSPCQQGLACEKDDDGDDLYKIYEQFKEMSLNVIDNDKVIELLQTIKDPEIRAQIIDKISDSKEKDHIAEKDYIPKEIPTKEGSYTMAEVKNLLLERRKMVSSPTTISDLKEEINNLKEDITLLKEKNVVIEVRLDAIQTLRNLDSASESSSSMEGENDNLDFIKNLSLKNDKTDFLYSLKAFTSQKHFYPANTKKVYNFSKLVVKRIISPEEWGMSTLKELDYIHPEQKVPVKYNYWDYIDGFNKVLLYENANRKHSWFIKLCAVFLIGIFLIEWIDISPKLTRLQEDNIFFEGISVMYFFIEFSIPWIMRWSIEVNTT